MSMLTTAKRDGDHYILNGSKTFITNAPIADVLVVFAKLTSGTESDGITAFLVDKGTSGFSVGKNIEKMGTRTSPMSEIYLDDCTIPVENRLGAEGGGQAIFFIVWNGNAHSFFLAQWELWKDSWRIVYLMRKKENNLGRRYQSFKGFNLNWPICRLNFKLRGFWPIRPHGTWIIIFQ